MNEIPRIYNLNTEQQYVPTALLAENVKKENVAAEKTAYLTFDDGPSENTKKVLKVLKKKQASATFFLVGSEITKEREAIVKKTIEQGNAVGVHTFSHEQSEIYRSETDFFADYEKVSARIREITGETPKLHRFPWGSNNGYVSSFVDSLHEKLASQGVKSFDWNVSGEDSVGGTVSTETIFQNVKKDLCRFDKPIILLHDSGAMKNTAAVLERLIDYIRSEGYGFDTLENREEYLFPASWR
jgi:peptidoglycan/xylan/chitin deacetylase (PgdA/CDA1 family)